MNAVAAAVLLIIAVLIYNSFFGGTVGTGPAGQPRAAVAAAPIAPKVLTDQEVQALIDRGRAMDKQLAESNKPRAPGATGFVLVTKADYTAARDGLLSVPDGHAAAPEAKRLLASFDKRSAEGEEITRKAVEKARADNVSGRKSFAAEYEKGLLRKGLSVSVYAEGDRSSSLRLKYALMSKALAFNMKEDNKLMDRLRELGFRKVILTDGYNDAWTVTFN